MTGINYTLLDDDHLVATAHQINVTRLEQELLRRFEQCLAERAALKSTGWDDENGLDALPGVLNVLNDYSITDADSLRRSLASAA